MKTDAQLDTLFPDIVGQYKVKRKLDFFLQSYAGNHIFPHSLLIAPRGSGKSWFSRAIGKHLYGKGEKKPKRFVEVTAATLKNLKQFMNQVVLPFVVGDKETTIFIDEAAAIKADIRDALLTILNPNPDNKNTLRYDDFEYVFDFSLVTFIFATTEPQDVFHALVDRLERIELEEYTTAELAKIVRKNLPHIQIDKKLMDEISGMLRGNPRQAYVFSNKVKQYLASEKRKELTKKDWAHVKQSLGMLPLGISEIELRILKLLYNRAKDPLAGKEGYSLTHLSSITDLRPQALQRDIERMLLRHNLMEIGARGRKITGRGMQFVRELHKDKQIGSK